MSIAQKFERQLKGAINGLIEHLHFGSIADPGKKLNISTGLLMLLV